MIDTLTRAQTEADRLAALDAYDVLDTPQEEAFDRITRLVTRLFAVPISTLTLIDGHRQWFKSHQGVATCETARSAAMCDHAIRQDEPLVVPDTHADPRFVDHPRVVGEPFVRFYAGVPLRAPGGHAIGTLCASDTRPRDFPAADVAALRDLAHVVENELALRMLATTDGLTGAASRLAFRLEAARAVALARRHGHPLACVVLDLDHFKRINDGQGHAMGDLVLAETIRTCRGHLRASDLVGRLGGEEFAIVLPHTDERGALVTAERLRAAVAGQRVLTGSGLLAISASFGVATLGADVGDLDDLLRRADAALLEAKAGGRDRCVAWRGAALTFSGGTKRRVLKLGCITFNGGRSVIDCTVRALSDESADLHVTSTAGVPQTFKLRIGADGLSRVCRVQSKREQHIEVVFEG